MTDIIDSEIIDNINVEATRNIDFQLDKHNKLEYLYKTNIPERALFVKQSCISIIKNFYENNIDIPMLINGCHGIGKLTCIIGLLQHIPCYLQDINIDLKLNNFVYFKSLDIEYNKILFYENIYVLNVNILNNNTEILSYLKYLYQIAKSSNITMYNSNCKFNSLDYDENDNRNTNTNSNTNELSNDKKIIIITHIDKCNVESQRYIAYMIEKITTSISYIFTSQSINNIDKKIMSSCANISFKPLDKNEFYDIFTFNFKNSLLKTEALCNKNIINQFYQIYVSNNYNIGNTISQIKYHLESEGIEFLQNKNNCQSLMSRIAHNFIKKRLILSKISSALEIRKFLYTLLSLNIKLIIFVKEVVNQLLKSKLNSSIKYIIIEKIGKLSDEFTDSNKEIIIVEAFFYDIITIIYGNEESSSKK